VNIFTWGYVLFAVLTVVLFWLVMPRKARPYFLLTASMLVVLYQPPKFVLLTLIYLLITWYLGYVIHASESLKTKKTWLISGIVISVLLLAYYKYGGFFTDVHLLSVLTKGKATASGLVPLGISYFTFRVISYLVEIYRGKIPSASVTDFLLYVTFFPTVLAGPIERFEKFQPQRIANAKLVSEDIYVGLTRITQGLFKKLVLSATFYQMITPYYSAVSPTGQVNLTTAQLWMIQNLYMLYLYMDFSGYSDIAIGTSRLFGYRIMENFNYPIFRPNIAAFWANWHISLTAWLRDYIYFALGGNKNGMGRSVVYSFITMGAFGAWHGSGSGLGHYLLFGFYHATLVVIFRFWRTFREKKLAHIKPSKIGYVVSTIFTYQLICLGWPIFVHPTWKAINIWFKTFGMDVNVRALFALFGG
jgi:alginate O-acetyltransferase complex protein AlgI